MRTLSRRGFFNLLTGIGGALAGHSLTATTAKAAATDTAATPPLFGTPGSSPAEVETFDVTGRVKWFDMEKGYGFIAPDDGRPDILLHTTCLRAGGYQTVREGAFVQCEVLRRGRSLQAFRILYLDEDGGVPLSRRAIVRAESGWEKATVKWFNRVRGFGFLTRGKDSPDIFVHYETVHRCLAGELRPGQVIDVRWGMGSHGVVAAELRPRF